MNQLDVDKYKKMASNLVGLASAVAPIGVEIAKDIDRSIANLEAKDAEALAKDPEIIKAREKLAKVDSTFASTIEKFKNICTDGN